MYIGRVACKSISSAFLSPFSWLWVNVGYIHHVTFIHECTEQIMNYTFKMRIKHNFTKKIQKNAKFVFPLLTKVLKFHQLLYKMWPLREPDTRQIWKNLTKQDYRILWDCFAKQRSILYLKGQGGKCFHYRQVAAYWVVFVAVPNRFRWTVERILIAPRFLPRLFKGFFKKNTLNACFKTSKKILNVFEKKFVIIVSRILQDLNKIWHPFLATLYWQSIYSLKQG